MLKTGLPEGSVRSKATQEGISDEVMDYFFNYCASNPIASAPAPAPAPQPVAQQPPAATPTQAAADPPGYEEYFEKYRKMLKMGLPEGSVRNKAAQDGCTSEVMDYFFQNCTGSSGGASSSAPAPAPTPAKPAPAPAPQPVAQQPPAATPTQASDPPGYEEYFEKYRKMLKMGLPEGSVRNKAAQDGCTSEVMDYFFKNCTGSSGGASSSAPAPAPAPAHAIAPAPTISQQVASQVRHLWTS